MVAWWERFWSGSKARQLPRSVGWQKVHILIALWVWILHFAAWIHRPQLRDIFSECSRMRTFSSDTPLSHQRCTHHPIVYNSVWLQKPRNHKPLAKVYFLYCHSSMLSEVSQYYHLYRTQGQSWLGIVNRFLCWIGFTHHSYLLSANLISQASWIRCSHSSLSQSSHCSGMYLTDFEIPIIYCCSHLWQLLLHKDFIESFPPHLLLEWSQGGFLSEIDAH